MADNRPTRTDLAARRRRAGASREAMAAGLGLRPDEIQEIEEGRASYDMVDHYAQWLDRIEAWPAEKRAQQLLAAIDGATRFVP
jgi:transcriptional regulator with XRE-family HTH domain